MLTISDPPAPLYWIALNAGVIAGVGMTGPGQLLISPADEVRTYTDRTKFAAETAELGYTGELP
jgi:hypothetical protein